MYRLQTIIETPEFIRRSRKIMNDKQRAELIKYLASNPKPDAKLGSYLRKARFSRQGQGKSGGYRVVYVFGGTDIPIILLTVFAKNEKSNLATSELRQAEQLAKQLVYFYRRQS